MVRIFAFRTAIATLLSVLSVAGFAQQSGRPMPSSPAPLRIGSGDLIEVSVYDTADLSGRFRVNENGDITVPLLGLVHLEGETAEEAGKTIEQRYVDADIFKPSKAHVTVFIAEYATQGILVTGEVRTVGLVSALGVRMLNDVISAAGGVTAAASSRIIITRKSDLDHPITVDYNPEALAPVIPRIQMYPGDAITVPRAGIVYVLGRVGRPGVYVLDGRQILSVEKVIALAGGNGPAAAMNRAHLVRTLDGGRKEDILLNIDKIQESKAPDIALQDGDILFVPTSNSKLALQQAIASALSIGTSLAVYRTIY